MVVQMLGLGSQHRVTKKGFRKGARKKNFVLGGAMISQIITLVCVEEQGKITPGKRHIKK